MTKRPFTSLFSFERPRLKVKLINQVGWINNSWSIRRPVRFSRLQMIVYYEFGMLMKMRIRHPNVNFKQVDIQYKNLEFVIIKSELESWFCCCVTSGKSLNLNLSTLNNKWRLCEVIIWCLQSKKWHRNSIHNREKLAMYIFNFYRSSTI